MLEKLQKLSSAEKITEFTDSLDIDDLRRLDKAWHLQGRENQLPELSDWRTWLLLGGRGAGKTRAGAEWIRAVVARSKLLPGDAAGRIALVGGSFADVRDVMIEGDSGLLAIHDKADRPNWVSSKRQLEWPNGTIGYAFSSEDPEQLRGSQFGAAWCDAKTIWGALLAVAAAVASAFGISIDENSQQGIADALIQLAGAGGALLAIYGRLTATDIID